MSTHKIIDVCDYKLNFDDSKSMIKYCNDTYRFIYNRLYNTLNNPKLNCLFMAKGYLSIFDEFKSDSYLCLGESRLSITNSNLVVININEFASLNFNKEILNDTIIHELTHYLQRLDNIKDPKIKFNEYYNKIYDLVKDELMIAKTNIEGNSHSLNFSERLNNCFSNKKLASEVFQIADDPNDPRLKGYNPWVHKVKIKY